MGEALGTVHPTVTAVTAVTGPTEQSLAHLKSFTNSLSSNQKNHITEMSPDCDNPLLFEE